MVEIVIAGRRQAGFTLIEMMVALMVLMFGLTALAGSMTSAVSTRRGSEMRLRAVHMVDRVLYDVEQDFLLRHGPDSGPLVAPEQPGEVLGYPSMRYRVQFLPDPEQPAIVLARISISWREDGQDVAETFDRVLIRELPFSRRVSRLRENL